ncbi:nucleotidyltransferase family protein [Candidatus Poribacteria bacterium]|nr:nucleotidyltransferase family protein [Candidatus Poribacteria bacterium]
MPVPLGAIAEFCQLHRIRKLSLFGSILRDDFTPESDVDILVEFEPGTGIGLMGMVRLERELSGLLARKVDLRTAGDLSEYFVDEVLKEAVPVHV